MDGGAWPFLVGGVICLVNSDNERDSYLLIARRRLNLIWVESSQALVGVYATCFSRSGHSAGCCCSSSLSVRRRERPVACHLNDRDDSLEKAFLLRGIDDLAYKVVLRERAITGL